VFWRLLKVYGSSICAQLLDLTNKGQTGHLLDMFVIIWLRKKCSNSTIWWNMLQDTTIREILWRILPF